MRIQPWRRLELLGPTLTLIQPWHRRLLGQQAIIIQLWRRRQLLGQLAMMAQLCRQHEPLGRTITTNKTGAPLHKLDSLTLKFWLYFFLHPRGHLTTYAQNSWLLRIFVPATKFVGMLFDPAGTNNFQTGLPDKSSACELTDTDHDTARLRGMKHSIRSNHYNTGGDVAPNCTFSLRSFLSFLLLGFLLSPFFLCGLFRFDLVCDGIRSFFLLPLLHVLYHFASMFNSHHGKLLQCFITRFGQRVPFAQKS